MGPRSRAPWCLLSESFIPTVLLQHLTFVSLCLLPGYREPASPLCDWERNETNCSFFFFFWPFECFRKSVVYSHSLYLVKNDFVSVISNWFCQQDFAMQPGLTSHSRKPSSLRVSQVCGLQVYATGPAAKSASFFSSQLCTLSCLCAKCVPLFKALLFSWHP